MKNTHSHNEREDFLKELGVSEVPKKPTSTLPKGHQERFLKKLKESSEKKTEKRIPLWRPVVAAVCVLVLFSGIWFWQPMKEDTTPTPQLSEETRASEVYFNQIIKTELAKLEEKTSPQHQLILENALQELDKMEADYQKIKEQMLQKGEQKLLIKAMITNFQRRINFLSDMLDRMEQIEKIESKNKMI